jgi:hypothetical protein
VRVELVLQAADHVTDGRAASVHRPSARVLERDRDIVTGSEEAHARRARRHAAARSGPHLVQLALQRRRQHGTLLDHLERVRAAAQVGERRSAARIAGEVQLRARAPSILVRCAHFDRAVDTDPAQPLECVAHDPGLGCALRIGRHVLP